MNEKVEKAKENVKEFVSRHKKKILIGVGVTAVGAIGIACKNHIKVNPYKLEVRASSPEYIDAVRNYFNWECLKPFNGGIVCYDRTDEQIRNTVDELLSDNAGNYRYGMILERISKDKIES